MIKRISSLALVLFIVSGLISPAVAEENRQPNFIYIYLDDAGYGDLSLTGQKHFTTPNLDRIGLEGMKFTQHYSGSTVCAPSRSVLMTGMHSGRTFIRGNKEVQPEGQWPLPEGAVTLPKLLQAAGYATGAFGKWGLGYPGSSGDPVRQGFDLFFGLNCQRQAHTFYPGHVWRNEEKIPLDGQTYVHELIFDQALEFVREHRERPFFLFLPLTIPHAAMQAPEEDAAPWRNEFWMYDNLVGRYAGTEVRNPVAAFAGMMTRVDRDVGRLIELLGQLELEERTIIMLSSDNGPHREGGHQPDLFQSSGGFRGYKRDLYEGGIRTFFLARWPGHIKDGTVSDLLSAQWDVLPTLCELAGIEPPPGLDGISLAPTLLGRAQEQKRHEFLYWEFHEQGGKQAVRQGDWKAVRLNVRTDPASPVELYHLGRDPRETLDIAAQQPAIAKDLRTLMEASHTPSKDFPFLPRK